MVISRVVPAQDSLPVDNHPAADAETSSPRFVWLDALRALAIMDIVSKHAGVVVAGPDGLPTRSFDHAVFGMGLPVFLLCSIALGARRSPPRPFKQHARLRAARLLKPYAVWWLIYLLFNTARHAVTGEWRFATLTSLNPAHLVLGTEYLLWYLPFILVAEVLANGLQQATDAWSERKPAWATGAWSLLSVLFLVLIPHPGWIGKGLPDGELLVVAFGWYRSIVCVPLGIALALAMRRRRQNPWMLFVLGLAAGVFVLCCESIVSQVPWPVDARWAQRMGVGVCLVCVACLLPERLPKPVIACLGQWASWTFGIYLVHIIVLWLIEAVFGERIGSPVWFYTWCGSVLLVLITRKITTSALAHGKGSL